MNNLQKNGQETFPPLHLYEQVERDRDIASRAALERIQENLEHDGTAKTSPAIKKSVERRQHTVDCR